MYLQIKKAKLVPDKYGNTIQVSMVGLYDDDGKWVKRVKLNDHVIGELLNGKFDLLPFWEGQEWKENN